MIRLYSPGFAYTTTVVKSVGCISEKIGRFTVESEKAKLHKLRKINRIRNLHATLKLHGSRLTESQINAIDDNQPVNATAKEILTAKNTIAAYNMITKLDYLVDADFRFIHHLLTQEIIEGAGHYRHQRDIIKVPPLIEEVIPEACELPRLVEKFFTWIKWTDLHPIIKCAMAYQEIELVYPFGHANGLMARFWLKLILCEWNHAFIDIPIEALLYERRDECSHVLQESADSISSISFMNFMMELIEDAVNDAITMMNDQEKIAKN